MDSTPTIVNQLEIVALESRCFIVGFALSENEGGFFTLQRAKYADGNSIKIIYFSGGVTWMLNALNGLDLETQTLLYSYSDI